MGCVVARRRESQRNWAKRQDLVWSPSGCCPGTCKHGSAASRSRLSRTMDQVWSTQVFAREVDLRLTISLGTCQAPALRLGSRVQRALFFLGGLLAKLVTVSGPSFGTDGVGPFRRRRGSSFDRAPTHARQPWSKFANSAKTYERDRSTDDTARPPPSPHHDRIQPPKW